MCVDRSNRASSCTGELSLADSSIAACRVCTKCPSPTGDEPYSSSPFPLPSRVANHQSNAPASTSAARAAAPSSGVMA